MAIQDELIAEFLGADAYLFTEPMYNLTMPSAFKARLDQIMVDGRTLSFDRARSRRGPPGRADLRARRRLRPRRPQARHGPPGAGAGNRDPTMLGPKVTTVTPELTMARHVPVPAPLLPSTRRR